MQKLTLTECDDAKSPNKGNSFEVMVNPASFSHEHSISYNEKSGSGKAEKDQKFNEIGAEKVSFEIVIDGTGVIAPATAGGTTSDVKTQIGKLKALVYTYNGTKHEPNYIQLAWGSFIFYGRLTSLSIDYNLFESSGDPLRAKLKLAFVGFASSDEEAAKANRSSPDLSHIVEVKAGDTLPLLCYRIYKDCSYYVDVARINNLTNFRTLKPGARLHFPPLR